MTTMKLTKPGTKAHATRMEKIATEIRKFLLDKDMWMDTRIYFNGKAFCSNPVYVDGKNVNYNNPAHLHIIEDIDPRQFVEYGNPDTITMTFEGSFYEALNYGTYGWGTSEAFTKLCNKYGYYFELGYAWSLSLYEN